MMQSRVTRFEVWSLGFRVEGLGLRGQGLELKLQGFMSGVQVLGVWA